MADVDEISFPRGKPARTNQIAGKKALKTSFAWNRSSGKKTTTINSTDEQRSDRTNGSRARKSLSRGAKPKLTKLDAKTAAGFDSLKLSSISPGMLLLSRVKEVNSADVKLGLPNNLEAMVSYDAISAAFSRRLETPPDNLNIASFDAIALERMLHEGQLLRCKILEIPLETSATRILTATIAPNEVNAEIEPQKLYEGMLIAGAVQSVEDHGYVIDTGIENVSGFLNFSNVGGLKQHFPDFLQVGQVLLLVVSKIPKATFSKGATTKKGQAIPPSVIQLSTDIVAERKKRDAKNDEEIPDITIRTALPGEIVNFKLTEIIPNRGIVAKHNKLFGYVSRWHLPITSSHGSELNSYAVDQQIDACVLYVDPVNNNVHLSIMPQLCDAERFYADPFEHRSVTHVIPDCEVVRASAKSGVFLRTPLEAKSGMAHAVFCSRKYTSRIEDDARWLKKYAPHSYHAIAVTGYNWMDGMLIASMRKDDVEQPLFAYEQLAPGQRVHGVVGGIAKTGVVVRLGGRLRGFVPAEQLADVPLSQKHWADKFAIGTRVQCKVIQTDAANQKLKLTFKRGLVDSTNRMYSDYQQVHQGDLCTGYVAQIRDKGLLVKFLQDVAGFIPRAELHDARVKLDDLFYVGQTVNCRVKSFKADRNGIILTPKIGTVIMSALGNDDDKKKSNSKLNVGDIVECNVIGRKGDSSIQVELLDGSGVQTSIGVEHLRDDYTACASSNPTARRALLGQYYCSNTEQQQHHQVSAVVIRTHPELMLTLKNSYIKMAQDKTLVKKFEELYEGMETFVYAAMIKEFGVFAEFSNGVRGLLPKKLFRDDAQQMLHMKPESLYVGATLPVKVVDIDQEKQRCLVRLWNPKKAAAGEGMSVAGDESKENVVAEKKRPRQRSDSTSSHKSVELSAKTDKIQQLRSKRVRLDSLPASASADTPATGAVSEVTTGPDGVLRLAMPDFEWKDPFQLDKFNAKSLSATITSENCTATIDEGNAADVNYVDAQVAEKRQTDKVRLSVPQLEQLVAEQPDSASVWVQYMKHYVDTLGDVEQARQIGERALRTMSYRAEAEKRRVWFALLDLDLAYAPRAQLEDRMERAVQSNDPLSIYMHVARALEQQQQTAAGGAAVAKYEYVDQLYSKMLKKFKHSKDVSVAYGRFLFATGRSDAARKLMQRCLTGSGAISSRKASEALDKRLHVELISKFAYFEFAYADRERAKSMMESVLDAYPKRVDVMNVYIDMLTKFNEPADYVRKVFEKLTSAGTVRPKKVQTIFKRYVDFEMAHGTPEQVELVKERARAYVNALSNKNGAKEDSEK